MFSCSACFRRAVTAALFHDLPIDFLYRNGTFRAQPLARNQIRHGKQRGHSTSPSTSRSFSRTNRLPVNILTNTSTSTSSSTGAGAGAGTRHHSTLQSLRKGHHLRVVRDTLKSQDGIPLKRTTLRTGPSKVERRNANARQRNKSVYLQDTNDPSPDQDQDQVPLQSAWSKERYEVQWLKDPLKLAQTVLERLRSNDVMGAVTLVRASDREKMENVVSWNHIMDYEMNFKNVKGALKVYNEMKKRGHKPDAHTYTIMLRGFAANVNKPQAVQNALNVYNSMFAPNSTISPNIIHTNAIINVCARAKDLDALWSVAGRLPEKGVGAPNKWTFTTILNALASKAQASASQIQQGRGPIDETDEQVRKVFDDAVADGLKLWGDVVERWRKGDLMVDQPLVCAMGRLLLLGSRKSGWEDVFGLVEQTMRIPKWRPAGEEQKTLPSPPPDSEFQPVDVSFPSADDSGKAVKGQDGEVGRKTGHVRAPNTSVYAEPGNNALSMLIQAAIMTKNVPAGKMYWDLLTDTDGPYKLEPDAANLASYLRLLRISRSSKAVVDLLRSDLFTRSSSLAGEFYKRGTFVIAMSTCVRDKNNPNVFEHANRILDVMQERLEQMDPKVMEMYVNLAVLTTPGVGSASPWKDMTFEKDATKNHAMRALKRLGPDVVNVKNLMKTALLEEEVRRPGIGGIRRKGDAEKRPSVEDLADFLKSMVGIYDRLLLRGAEAGVERALLEEWLGQKRKLSAFVTKMEGGVRLRSGRGAGQEGDRQGAEEDEEEGEDHEPTEVAEMKDKRWERNPVVSSRKGPLTKTEKRVERIKRDFPDPRDMKKYYERQDRLAAAEGRPRSSGFEERKQRQMQMQMQQKQTQVHRDEDLVVKGWGSAFGEMEKDQRLGGKSHGMAL